MSWYFWAGSVVQYLSKLSFKVLPYNINVYIVTHYGAIQHLDSLWPIDTTWRHKSGSTLVQVMAWCCQAPIITWTNVDLSSVRSSRIHLSAILQEIPQPPVTEISLKITSLKFCSNLPGAKECMSVPGVSALSWLLCTCSRLITNNMVMILAGCPVRECLVMTVVLSGEVCRFSFSLASVLASVVSRIITDQSALSSTLIISQDDSTH